MANLAYDSGKEPGSGVRLEDALSWVDARFGPIRNLAGFKLVGPEPSWWVYSCTLARAPAGAWFSEQLAGAAGTSIDRSEALTRCIGEFLERYSALNVPVGGELALPDVAGLAGRFPRCAPDEPCAEDFRTIDPNEALTHVPVERLATGAIETVPAGYVHLGFWPDAPERPVTLPISTGLAFDRSLAGAMWRGICEVAERDAMMLTWWSRRPAMEIDCSGPGLTEALVDRLARLAQVHLHARFFDISTDFRIPTVFCVLSGHHYPYLVVGACCKTDPAEACAKALDEAVSARVTLANGSAFRPPSLQDFGWVNMLEHHAMLYATGQVTQAFDFLLQPGRPQLSFAEFEAKDWWKMPQGLQALREFASAREREGLTILWSDVTAPEVLEQGRVVKVLIPEMIPLSQTHNVRWLATTRLTSCFEQKADSCNALNPFPHPFA